MSAAPRAGWGAMPAAPASGLDQEVVDTVLGRAGKPTPTPTTTKASAAATTTTTTAATNRPKAPGGGAWTSPSPFTGATTHAGTASHDGGAASQGVPLYDVYVVLDFEATCIRDKRMVDPEVIEFPMVLVDARTHGVVAEFQRYVRPVRHPTLSDFCTELTGITQAQVDPAQTFEPVFAEAKAFLARAGLGDASPQRSYCFVTCGDWDLQTMLPAQLNITGQLGVPPSFQRWCNLKKFMESASPPLSPRRGKKGVRVSGMPDMLSVLGLPLKGHHHSGIDDCRNIASALCELLRRGYHVKATKDVNSPAMSTWLAPDEAGLVPLSQLTSSLASSTTPTPTPAAAAAPRTQVNVAQPQEARIKKDRKEKPDRRQGAGGGTGGGAAPQRLPALRVDTSRDPVRDILGSAGTPSASVEPWRAKTLSKSLSHLLRHGADERGVVLTVNGYARLDAVLSEPTIRKLNLTAADVMRAVSDSDKQRFRVAYSADDGQLYICAAQGHSLEGVMPDLKRITSPEECPQAVHGTYWPAWRLIQETGYLSPMSRTHIHFAKGLPTDQSVISGMRTTAQVVLYLDVTAALNDGVELYESSNGVILTSGVGDTRQLPLKYISKAVDQKTKAVIEF